MGGLAVFGSASAAAEGFAEIGFRFSFVQFTPDPREKPLPVGSAALRTRWATNHRRDHPSKSNRGKRKRRDRPKRSVGPSRFAPGDAFSRTQTHLGRWSPAQTIFANRRRPAQAIDDDPRPFSRRTPSAATLSFQRTANNRPPSDPRPTSPTTAQPYKAPHNKASGHARHSAAQGRGSAAWATFYSFAV